MGIYAAQWHDYRQRHRAAVAGLLGGPVVAMLLALLLTPMIDGSLILVRSLFLVWGAVWSWLSFRVTRFPCPRCGKSFNSGLGCERCQLMLYEGA